MLLGAEGRRAAPAEHQDRWEGAVASTPEKEWLVSQEEGAVEQPGIPRCKSNTGLLVRRWAIARSALWVGALLLGSTAVASLAALALSQPAWRQSPRAALPLEQKFSPRAEPPRDPCLTTGGLPACPAISLFDQTKVHKVATENILRMGRRLLSAVDMELVHDIVAASFRNVSWRIQRSAPRLSVALQMLQLSEMQQEAVLSLLRLMSDPQVQRIGLEVARGIHSANSMEAEAVRQSIQRRLRQMTGEIRQLRDQVVPLPLQKLWGYGHLWSVTLDLENIHIMAGSSNHSDIMGLASGPVKLEDSFLGVQIGALEEGRALVDLVKQIARLSGQEADVPAWSTTISNKVLRDKKLSCKLESLEANYKDLLRAWFCPLKFGSQGLDALRAVSQLPLQPMEEINLFQS